MPILIRTSLFVLALLLLCTAASANCGDDHYTGDSGDDYYSSDSSISADDDYSGGPGLTAEQAEAYGAPTAVAGDYALRDMGSPSQAQWALRGTLAKLWEEHIVYTRNVIVGIANDSPAVNSVVARLLQNQTDIGNALKPYYGNAAGDQVAALLKDHIKFAGDAVKALKANDTAKAGEATKNLYANADQIAAFLSKANPQAWPESAVKQMLYTHLDLLAKQAKAELSGDWQGSIKAYDDGHKAILQMANALSDGIIMQLPDKF